jgi:hypothetical protein
VAVTARRDAAADLAVDADGLVAERDGLRVLECQAAELGARPFLRRLHQSVSADEPALLLELDAEADAALVRSLVGGDVGAPDPIALLEPQRVDRAVAARHHSVRFAGFPQGAPQAEPVLGRAVELPAELADVGHPQRPDGDVPDCELADVHVGEGLVAEVLRRQRLQDLARLRAPDAEARVLRGDVVDLNGAIPG